MKYIKKILLYLFGISGIILFYLIYPKIFPEANIQFKIDNETAKKIAIQNMLELGNDTSNYVFSVQPNINWRIVNLLHFKYGLSEGNKKLKKIGFVYYQISAVIPNKKEDRTVLRYSNDPDEVRKFNTSYPSFSIIISSDGKLLTFKRMIPDTMAAEPIDTSLLHLNNIKILNKYFPDFSIISEKVEYRKNYKRDDVFYNFQGIDSDSNRVTVDILMNGPKFGLIKKYYSIESEEALLKSILNVHEISSLIQTICIIGLFFLLLFLVIKRYKNDEINLKYSSIFSAVFSFLFTVYIFLLIFFSKEQSWIELSIGILFIFIFFFAFFFVIIAGTDSISRVFWNEKFHSFDAFRKGYLFRKKVKESIFDGFAISGIFLLLSALFYLGVEYFSGNNFYFTYDGDLISFLLLDSTPYGSIAFLTKTFTISFLYILGFPVLLTSIIKIRFNNNYIAFGAAFIIISLIDFPLINKPSTIELFYIYNLLFTGFLLLLFIKSDILTFLWSYFLSQIIIKIVFLSYAKLEYSNFSLILLLAFTGGIFLIYLISLFFKEKKTIDYEDLSPKFVKRITERERISKEIDAARHIQKSFLPYKTPDFEGLEIAANCIPALEVGGDYYDYFILDKEKLGIVIADVSGKGLKAAFYMTLIKGIIKAQTQEYISPKIIVSKLNKLLYEIIEKGNFVSLIYGVFDVTKNCFIYVNAGHNPIIYKNITTGKTVYDKMSGMALGLSDETVFEKNVEERVIKMRPGDLFIFYTDGYTEAMNKEKKEYGNEEFLNLISQVSTFSPHEIINTAESEIKKHIGKAQQHDDMTVVVVRIK